jgi:hypothetical protein
MTQKAYLGSGVRVEPLTLIQPSMHRQLGAFIAYDECHTHPLPAQTMHDTNFCHAVECLQVICWIRT